MRTVLRNGSRRNGNQKKSSKLLGRAIRSILPDLSGLETLEDRRMLSVPPPTGWANQDIGRPGDPVIAGDTTYSAFDGHTGASYSLSGTFTQLASGSDDWTGGDHLQYAWDTTKLDGDGKVIVTVNSFTPTSGTLNAWAKTGIMFRAANPATGTFDVGNQNLSLCLTGGNAGGMQVVVRPAQDALAQTYSYDYSASPGYSTPITTTGSLPLTMALSRQGNNFTASWLAPLLQISYSGTVGATMQVTGDASGNPVNLLLIDNSNPGMPYTIRWPATAGPTGFTICRRPSRRSPGTRSPERRRTAAVRRRSWR